MSSITSDKDEIQIADSKTEKEQSPGEDATGPELFEKFLETCKQLVELDPEIREGIEKIRKRFAGADPAYRDSPSFIKIIQESISKVSIETWECMKEISDVLKLHSIGNMARKPNEACEKTEYQIHELEITLDELHSKIQHLEEEEVNFEETDDENSPYIKVSRYKERFCQVYEKILKLKKIVNNEALQRIRFSGTKIPSVNRAIERFYNDRREFPNFCDINSLVLAVNERKNLNLPPSQIHEIAKTAFKELGHSLKRQRQHEFYNNLICSYLPNEETDPALVNDELQQKLLENERLHGHKIDDIINRYAIQHDENHLEHGEVGMDEALISDSKSDADSI